MCVLYDFHTMHELANRFMMLRLNSPLGIMIAVLMAIVTDVPS